MRVGLQVFGTRTGLGYQTRALHRHLAPAKTMLIDLSEAKGMPLADGWYGPEVTRTRGAPTDTEVGRFLDDLDVVLVCETPLNHHLFLEAHRRRVATILQYNYEFLEHIRPQGPSLPLPTVFAAPTTWHLDDMRARWPHVWSLPVPVDTTGFPDRTVTEARTISHIAGQPTTGDRNGTMDFITVARRCDDLDAEFVLHCQIPNSNIMDAIAGTRIKLVTEVPEPGDLYRQGDILVLPRRYGGLCMPAQDAVACGIPVLMPAVPPNVDWLPRDWLIPARPAGMTPGDFPPVPVETWQVDLDSLERAVRSLTQDPARVTRMASQARALGATITWDALRPTYDRLLTRAWEAGYW